MAQLSNIISTACDSFKEKRGMAQDKLGTVEAERSLLKLFKTHRIWTFSVILIYDHFRFSKFEYY
jgi:hypothetical protein